MLVAHFDLHRDVLCELAFVGDLPLPNSTPATPPYSNTQDIPADGPTAPVSLNPGHPNVAWPSNIDGSHYTSENIDQSSLPAELNSQPQEGSFYPLPVYREELGWPSVHGQVEFSPQAQSLGSIANPSYWNHATTHDTSIPGGVSGSTRPSHSYSSTSGTVGGSSLSTDGLPLDSVGFNYASLVPELLLSSHSLSGSTLFNVGADSTGIDLHQMHTSGEGIQDLVNAPATTNTDALAMWSNAPSGFECVGSSSDVLVTKFIPPSLEEWEAYITSVSHYMHGQPTDLQHP